MNWLCYIVVVVSENTIMLYFVHKLRPATLIIDTYCHELLDDPESRNFGHIDDAKRNWHFLLHCWCHHYQHIFIIRLVYNDIKVYNIPHNDVLFCIGTYIMGHPVHGQLAIVLAWCSSSVYATVVSFCFKSVCGSAVYVIRISVTNTSTLRNFFSGIPKSFLKPY